MLMKLVDVDDKAENVSENRLAKERGFNNLQNFCVYLRILLN